MPVGVPVPSMGLRSALLGSKLRVAGTVLVALLATVAGLYAGGVLGVPSVDGFENRFGTVTDATTEVVTDVRVSNPNPFTLGLGSLAVDYRVSLNDVELATGSKQGLGAPPGESTVTLRTYIDNTRIPDWWVSHLRNGERTQVRVTADIAGGFGLSTTQTPVNRSLETDILGAFNSTTDRPIDANVPLVEDPVAVIRRQNASFGTVTDAETPVEVSFVVYNPKDRPVTLSEIGYDVDMNDVDVGEGRTEEAYVIEPRTSETVRTTVRIRNERLDEWWVSHLRNDQRTVLAIDFSARLSSEGLGSVELPLEGIDYRETFETDIFGGAGPGGEGTTDGNRTTTDGSGTESGPTGGTTAGGTTTAGDGGNDGSTTTDDGGLLALEPDAGFKWAAATR